MESRSESTIDFDLHLDNLVITGVEMRRLSASNNQPIISNTKNDIFTLISEDCVNHTNIPLHNVIG